MEKWVSQRNDFDYILCLDVSRWGRFQDIDLLAQFTAQCRRHNKQIIYENCMQDDSDVALLLDEPVDASDDEDSFIQAGVSGSGLVELSISGADASGWTIITQAILRVRGRTYDKTGAGVPLGATMEFRPQDSIHTQAGFTFENPTTGQCCSSRWATY